jgi:uncharacterized damage-inducible protein DinB
MAQTLSASAEALREHLAYHVWASRRLLDAVATLSVQELNRDFQTATHSVLGTLVHVFAADRTWLGRLRSAPPAEFVSKSDHDFAVLQEQWPGVHAGWLQWGTTELTDELAQSAFTYCDLKRNPWTQPVWQIVLHAVNHGTHHRGQVSGFLRAMGHTPPPLDLIVYYRQQTRR